MSELRFREVNQCARSHTWHVNCGVRIITQVFWFLFRCLGLNGFPPPPTPENNISTRICERNLLWKKELSNTTKLKISRWGHPGWRWVLNPMTSVLRREEKGGRHTEELMWRWRQKWEWCLCRPGKAKDPQQPPDGGCEAWSGSSPEAPEGTSPATTLILDFCPP